MFTKSIIILSFILASSSCGVKALTSNTPPTPQKSTPTCATTKLVNTTEYEWNYRDWGSMQQAKKTCDRKHRMRGCLVSFTKVGETSYQAICGWERLSRGDSVRDEKL